MKEKLRGTVEWFLYPKEGPDQELIDQLQFLGFKLKTRKGEFACFGKCIAPEIGDYVELEGFFEDKKGRFENSSFQFDLCLRVDDDEDGAKAMLKWLFGEKTSAKVLSGFDGDALMALDAFKNNEDMFLNKTKRIRRFGYKTYCRAKTKYEDHIGIDVVYRELRQYDISIQQALKLYLKLGPTCMEKIEENPYVMAKWIPFSKVDHIAISKYGLAADDSRRVYAGAMHCIKEAQSKGHCYLNLNRPYKRTKTQALKTMVSSVLNIQDDTLVNDQLIKLKEGGKLCFDQYRLSTIVYTPEMAEAEKNTAINIVSRLQKTLYPMQDIEDYIEEFEENNFQLDTLQEDAIKVAVSNQLSLISGPPGSGKTTIINVIVSMLESFRPNGKVMMCSPTGKAAQRMKESTGQEASTIHRLLKYDPVSKDFLHNESNKLNCDVLVVDEFSMCGILLFSKLLAALPQSCQIILVGDKDQLPSIEPGKVLEDLLGLDFIPKQILSKVYRQKDGSMILKDALTIGNEDVHAIRKFKDADDIKFHECNDSNKLQAEVVDRFLAAVKEYGVENVCILTPMKKHELGTFALNSLIQDKLHPHFEDEPEMKIGAKRCFRKGDRVIQTKNEPEYDVFNGDVGTIINIEKADKDLGVHDTFYVDFGKDVDGDDHIVEYSRDRFDNLQLAYAITIHKSQGSEYKNVLMILDRSQSFMLQKKLVYTGWTRAKERLDIFGQKEWIEYSVTHKEIDRNSKLRNNIIQEYRKVE